MNTKLILRLLVLLVTVTVFSYFYIPDVFRAGGGSCYQGITAMIIRFWLILCTLLNLLSLYAGYKLKGRTAKTLISISFILWVLWSLIIGSSYPLAGILYFSPFLITLLIVLIFTYRQSRIDKVHIQ
jgi:hypothetical protein